MTCSTIKIREISCDLHDAETIEITAVAAEVFIK